MILGRVCKRFILYKENIKSIFVMCVLKVLWKGLNSVKKERKIIGTTANKSLMTFETLDLLTTRDFFMKYFK